MVYSYIGLVRIVVRCFWGLAIYSWEPFKYCLLSQPAPLELPKRRRQKTARLPEPTPEPLVFFLSDRCQTRRIACCVQNIISFAFFHTWIFGSLMTRSPVGNSNEAVASFSCLYPQVSQYSPTFWISVFTAQVIGVNRNTIAAWPLTRQSKDGYSVCV